MEKASSRRFQARPPSLTVPLSSPMPTAWPDDVSDVIDVIRTSLLYATTSSSNEFDFPCGCLIEPSSSSACGRDNGDDVEWELCYNIVDPETATESAVVARRTARAKAGDGARGNDDADERLGGSGWTRIVAKIVPPSNRRHSSPSRSLPVPQPPPTELCQLVLKAEEIMTMLRQTDVTSSRNDLVEDVLTWRRSTRRPTRARQVDLTPWINYVWKQWQQYLQHQHQKRVPYRSNKTKRQQRQQQQQQPTRPTCDFVGTLIDRCIKSVRQYVYRAVKKCNHQCSGDSNIHSNKQHWNVSFTTMSYGSDSTIITTDSYDGNDVERRSWMILQSFAAQFIEQCVGDQERQSHRIERGRNRERRKTNHYVASDGDDDEEDEEVDNSLIDNIESSFLPSNQSINRRHRVHDPLRLSGSTKEAVRRYTNSASAFDRSNDARQALQQSPDSPRRGRGKRQRERAEDIHITTNNEDIIDHLQQQQRQQRTRLDKRPRSQENRRQSRRVIDRVNLDSTYRSSLELLEPTASSKLSQSLDDRSLTESKGLALVVKEQENIPAAAASEVFPPLLEKQTPVHVNTVPSSSGVTKNSGSKKSVTNEKEIEVLREIQAASTGNRSNERLTNSKQAGASLLSSTDQHGQVLESVQGQQDQCISIGNERSFVADSKPSPPVSTTQTENGALTVFDKCGRRLAPEELSDGRTWIELNHVGQISDYHGFQRKYENAFKLKFNRSIAHIRNEISSILRSIPDGVCEDEDYSAEEALYLAGISKRSELAALERTKRRKTTEQCSFSGEKSDETTHIRIVTGEAEEDKASSQLFMSKNFDLSEREVFPSCVFKLVDDADDYLDARDALENPGQKRPSRTTKLTIQKKKSAQALKELSNNLFFIETYNSGFGRTENDESKTYVECEMKLDEIIDDKASDEPQEVPNTDHDLKPSQKRKRPERPPRKRKEKLRKAKPPQKVKQPKVKPYRYTPSAFNPTWEFLDPNAPVEQYVKLQEADPSFVKLKFTRNKKGAISKLDIDRIIEREGGIDNLCESNHEMLKVHKKIARSYRRFADQERLEKIEYEQKCEQRHAQHVMFSKKVSRNKEQEKEAKDFLFRPIVFAKKGDEISHVTTKPCFDDCCCAFGDTCPICLSKDFLKDDNTGKGCVENSVILMPGFRRVRLEEIDVPSEEEQESRRVASLLKLSELSSTIAFIEKYNQGLIQGS